MPFVCVFFAVWYGKNNKIKAFEKESANLLYYILPIIQVRGKKKKKLSGKKVQTKKLKTNQEIEN